MKTDTELQRDVMDELEWEPSIKAAEIGVGVKDGVVKLSGYVDTLGEKWIAERAVVRVFGVKAVAGELKVRLPSSVQRPDEDIAQAAANALQWNVWISRMMDRKIRNHDVIDLLFNLFIFREIPEYIRSDNGPEFTAKAVRKWLNRLGVKTLFIEPGSPWENGYIESFNGKLRDELLNREIFTTLEEAKVLIEQWRREYNQVRPHSSLGYRPPAPEAILSGITI